MIFQPIGLSEFHGSNKLLIIAGYGGVTFIILIFNLLLLPWRFKKWYDETSWTVFKQILRLFLTLFSIGFGNYLYSALIFNIFWGIHGFLLFQFYTLVIGIIPVIVITVIQQNIWLSQNLKSAKEFNKHIINKDPVTENNKVCLTGDNLKDKFEIELSRLNYIESTGNYIKIFYDNDDKIKNTILRCALKRAENQLEGYQSIIKCHRAFIVNITKIIHTKGNSQGLQLILKNTESEIPVSRNLTKKIKEHIQFYWQE